MQQGYCASSVTIAGQASITAIGAKLRRSKLNELPQLWNVLIGDMSMVGPRPDVEGYVDALTGRERLVLSLRPGITGPATLKYRDEEHLLAKQTNPVIYNDEVIFPDKVRINLHYAQHHSLWIDLKIIFCTLFDLSMNYNGEVI